MASSYTLVTADSGQSITFEVTAVAATGTSPGNAVTSSGITVTITFTIGGTVSGLLGSGMVLQNSGGDNLAISGDGAFTFATAIVDSTAYNVTVLTQPTGPSQTCTIANSSGTVSANVTNVTVTCPAPAGAFSIDTLNDPLALQQWHLRNTGQTAYADSAGVTGMDVNVDPVYGLSYDGNGVIVAVVDSGLEIAHEDLTANVVVNGSWNFSNSTTDPTNTATDGDHGTSMAMGFGLVAAG